MVVDWECGYGQTMKCDFRLWQGALGRLGEIGAGMIYFCPSDDISC